MLKNRFQLARGYGFAALCGIAVVAACGDDKAGFKDTVPAAGSGGASGWTFVPVASDNGGTTPYVPSAGTASTGGSSASHGGVGGTAGTGGNMIVPPVTFACGGKVPNQPIITSFDGFMADRWMSPGNLDGGAYVYPDTLKLAAGDFLRFDSQVKDYTGFGVWFSGCIDGSKFRGVRFTLSGAVGASQTVSFYLITNRDKEVVEADNVGACVPADPNDTWQSCRPPLVTLPVSAEPTVRSVPWSAFKGGLPSATTDGSDVIALQWTFDWTDGATPYDAQLTVDDVEFFNTPDTGSGGTAGEGGTRGENGGVAATGRGGQP